MRDIWYVYLERAGGSWRTAPTRDQSSGQFPAWPNPSPGRHSFNSDARLLLLGTSWFGLSFSEGKTVLGLCLALPNPGKGHVGLPGADPKLHMEVNEEALIVLLWVFCLDTFPY